LKERELEDTSRKGRLLEKIVIKKTDLSVDEKLLVIKVGFETYELGRSEYLQAVHDYLLISSNMRKKKEELSSYLNDIWTILDEDKLMKFDSSFL